MSTTEEVTRRRISDWFQAEVINPIEDFQNPKQEWRRLFSELFGTFFLVLVAAGGGNTLKWPIPRTPE
jgi:aquaporin Z